MVNSDNSNKGRPNGKNAFGTFKGVYLPSILTVFGVIMYLRLGWVLGNTGLLGTSVIITISSVITLITALSLASIATNMRVGVGGAYFMISRSFGIEAGAAIGVPLFFAKAVGISFYIAGFSESVASLLPDIHPTVICVISLSALTVLAYVSADLALKASMIIFVLIAASLVSFFSGGPPPGGFASVDPAMVHHAPFWIVFAVFFPAVTGIETGLSMSGDLKNPARSLPLGTIAAVATGYVVYMAIPIFLNTFVPKDILLTQPMIVEKVSRFGLLIFLGIWGASLSSALGSLLGAPRTLQALGRDRVVFSFLGKGHGDANTPRIATAASFIVALIAILLGDLNAIAQVLTMFFLTTYGILNLISGLEGLIGNPSWRPSFKTPWYVSLTGAAMCLVAMFMISAGATFIAMISVALVYYVTARRRLNPHWMDIRRSIYLFLARFSIYRLAESAEDPRTWRPNILVLTGAPTKRLYLVELADAISHGKGFLTVASILREKLLPEGENKLAELEKLIRKYLKERDIPALVEVTQADDLKAGIQNLVRSYGIGPITPNTIMLGESEDPEDFAEFAETIMLIRQSRKNVVIVRKSKFENSVHRPKKEICCWWGGKAGNAGFMLVLGYLLQTSPEWSGTKLKIKTIAKNPEDRDVMLENLRDFLKKSRLPAEPDVLVHDYGDSPLSTTIRESSADSDLVIIGMRPPGEGESVSAYTSYYKRLIENTRGYPDLMIVLTSQDLKFQEIFD